MLHGLGDCTPELHCGCLGRFHVGQKVVYRPRPDAPPEEGFVTSMNERFVFVRYGMSATSQATLPEHLEPLWKGADQ